jgi:hypothetical protein
MIGALVTLTSGGLPGESARGGTATGTVLATTAAPGGGAGGGASGAGASGGALAIVVGSRDGVAVTGVDGTVECVSRGGRTTSRTVETRIATTARPIAQLAPDTSRLRCHGFGGA